ncbi:type I-B CRISPR-associated protein Cas5b [Methanobrevibacter sp. UBA412]|jgi:CRISPR-associated protein Cas5h|uniref:type I-B CRISPR-associated protein Cas5b n=1 Tax=Methanobrevibacter sp. UBA412 TaxID=1915486 RepID=UPI0039B99B88
MISKVLAFDVWADYGYFRRGYTTTSTISYPFPSRTTVAGLISAMLGLPRDSYYDIFDEENSKIGVNILNPIKKVHFNLNYINTKEGFFLHDIRGPGKRSQVEAEFLKNPKYRIYVGLEDQELMGKLYDLLWNHKSIYTPYLGISECIANFSMVGDDFIELKQVNGDNVCVDSVIPKEGHNLVIESDRKYGLIKTPCFMDSNRVVTSFKEFYFEENTKSIQLESADYYKIGGDNVILF